MYSPGMTHPLGTVHHLSLPQGPLRYYDQGTGRPLVFVHGVLTNPLIWRKVIPALAADFRCLAPELPLGAHSAPMPATADLTAPAVATLLGDFLTALDLHDVVLVANDTGGAITQLLLARHPARVAKVVLTPSDSFEYFFPPLFKPLPALARVPGAMPVLAQLLRIKALHRLPFLFGWVTKRPLPPDIAAEYLEKLHKSPEIRRDLRKFLRSVPPRHTLAAAEKLREFAPPVLLVWPPEDKLFPISLAHRLAAVLPDAEVVEVEDSYTFVPEDQPDVLASHLKRFAAPVAD